ncbi:UDP-N-acetylglucosamine--N-acetylmuramyl-(pentapeptide) pyrophosphoryl-undecaprenol N-acetylglucosamine transferase [Helicobacter himalayensis]|uniref:UDP-N-acetylglucosamine--N-acetylmuramyl- (pentapeptide) pyrophosphoryl-undecaprenol N-acetylglucosamine transferase n=1 Tax=Helicobacter himalayensis TaxID=1591088 RepID=UPI00082C179F|nr:UDP-N-acetylglucosamine--N-acetylmuramyl-(pentapeptide) pyrophosphoryl-undecaprenol N-acetylglucosamine transferase [Helicobacter himalayensis]
MFAITGGGTGGHLAIAKALALELKARNLPCVYIGSTLGQDKLWFGESSASNANEALFVKTYFLQSTGVVNKRGLAKLGALLKVANATKLARKIFKIHNVHAVISVGGFSAAGASIGALICRIPLFIHEQNAMSGSLNKILSPFAKAVFSSFPQEHTGFFKARNFVQCAYPIRKEFFVKARVREKIDSVLFLGGSQGARTINNLALELAPKLLELGIKVFHQCGKNDFERVKEAYAKQGILERVNAFSYNPNLVELMERSDVCISRSGASSVWETCANGLPCFFVPYPYAHKNHQYFNALEFQKKGLAEICTEYKLDSAKVLTFLQNLKPKISQISQILHSATSPNGAKEIITQIESVL